LKVDDKGDDENLRGFKSGLESFQCVRVGMMCVSRRSVCERVCGVHVCVKVVDLHVMRKHLNYWELWKTVIVCWILQGGSRKEGLWFFVKLVKQSLQGWNVLFSCSYVLSIWEMVSWTLLYAIYWDSNVYVTKCNLGFGFLWKFNVVMGWYGLKKLRGEGRLVNSKERSDL
jgi:hypothetical protein